MASINSVTISGNLGKDPELKEFQTGTKKVMFSVAVSEPVKSNNKWETKTTWVLVEFWGNDADYISKYATKGSFIVVNGKLTEDTWEKDGQTQRKFYIKGFSFNLPRVNKVVEAEPEPQDSYPTFDENLPF